VRRDLDVRGLKVEMGDAAFMGGVQAVADALCNVQRVFYGNAPARDALRQIFALNQFEHEITRAFRYLEVVNDGDIRMVERRENFRFTLESAHSVNIARELVRQNLDRDFALELQVAGAVDLAHAAFAEQSGDFVGTEDCAEWDRHKSANYNISNTTPRSPG